MHRWVRALCCACGICANAGAASPDRVERLLEELTNAYGPPGFEEPVRVIMRRELAPLAGRIETDGLGSLIAELKGSDSPRVMLAAHMDELGMLVKYIAPDGFIHFEPLGGWLDQALIGQRFVILARKGPVEAVTGLKTPHVMSVEERGKPLARERMFLDAGAASKQDAEERLGIRPGDPIAPDSKFMVLNGGRLYLAKAWDDRIGLAVMIETLRRLKDNRPPNTLYAVSTVQEEIGLRGAQTATYLVKPDIGINLEVGVAADYPGTGPEEAQERLNGGPGIFLKDSSMLPNLKLRDYAIETARTRNIPVQFDVVHGSYGEDGAEMQRAFGGIPSINITIPARYLHNHNGVISRDDFDRTVDLIVEIILHLDAKTVSRLKSFE